MVAYNTQKDEAKWKLVTAAKSGNICEFEQQQQMGIFQAGRDCRRVEM